MSDTKIQVGIIIGGRSVEHEISLISGLQAHLEIDYNKYDSTLIYLGKNNKAYVGSALNSLESFKDDLTCYLDEVVFVKENNQVYYQLLKKPKKRYPIDVFIPVVHGYGTEDGTVAGFLEMLDAVYSSSKVIPSSIVQDKVATKALLDKYKIPTLGYKVYFENIEYNLDNMTYPAIIKPAYLGSSIGIKLVNNKDDFVKTMDEAFMYNDKVLVEKALINYLEYNCAIIKDHEEYILSDIEEVKHQKDILSFYDKYESNEKNRIIPAIIDETLEEKIKSITKDIYIKFGLSGVVRIDYLYDLDKNKLYVNEINNIPGSLAYYLFDSIGISFKELINILIQNAIIEKYKNNNKITNYKSNVVFSKINKIKK